MSDGWFSRPVLFVADVAKAIEFYTRLLGFEPGNSYEENGVVLVGEVSREDCHLLLNSQQPDKIGHGRMFISLDPEPFKRLREEFEQRGAPVKDGWWGYDLMVVEDPDGNELFFPHPGS
jgi:catechol 2,3-dioxygenase-like lactoylglutathione lyase family enzyme